MHYYAIIVAGGTGSRMNSEIPKQFIPIAGKPVLMHTLAAFSGTAEAPEIIVVMHPEFHTYWEELCLNYGFTLAHTVVDGGETRYHSVKKALHYVQNESIVAIHDAVRPLISTETISIAYREAAIHGSAVVAFPSPDSVRISSADSKSSKAIDRTEVFLVQTPQAFRAELLCKAYEAPFQPVFTDDASVVEFSGHNIHLVAGDRDNLKITFPADLLMAELLLKQKNLAR